MKVQKLNVVKIINEKLLPYYEGKGFRRIDDEDGAEKETKTTTSAAKKATK